MTRRNFIRLSSYTALSLVLLIAFAMTNTRNMNTYKNSLEVSYRQSLAELDECLDSVNTDLTKSLYSNSAEEMKEISRDLYAKCSVAKNAVSRLPVSQMELGNTYKFLSQASDYAQYIGTKIERGEVISDKEHKNLKVLLKYAGALSKSTAEMVDIAERGAKITDGAVKNTAKISASPLKNSFSQSAKSFESFPSLLYDGPFSDQVLNKESELLKKANAVSKNDCRRIAARALETNENRISYENESKGRLPSYTFKSGRYTVAVTKQGGYLKSVLYSGKINESNISEKNAAELAQKFLNKIGYTDMKQSYYSVNENVCTVNFAYAKSGVYCYSDLIKVSVSMDNGDIIALDASTYLTNHRDRTAFKAKIGSAAAQKKLSPYLTVNGIKKTVIPKENGTEEQCWEFFCTSLDTGEDTLIYINNRTGREEDILLLLYSDSGTLVK